ncbi:hypothetical protein DUNSADRAFT_144 [Dunaliella salina]|nr:hypothetical protein DUNSADRAFT_144 [Dunaliella salina]|eukprot:KAF5839714.1 hypothetical protein DUNSADRAFT_144 [Dunaliella salina]
MEQRITFDFDFQRLTDFYLGRASNSLKVCLFPATLRRAAKKARSEQLYVVLREEEKPLVVWKRFGKEPIMFLAEEVEDMIVTTKPPLGGTRTVVKLVGEEKELLEIYSLQEPELFLDTVQDLRGGARGRIAEKESRAAQPAAEMRDNVTHATTQILARDPLVSESRPVPDRISTSQPNRSIRGLGSDRAKSPSAVTPSQPSSRVPRKQNSIGGEPYSNPLFAHGKIRYHMIMPEAVPSHLFYSRPEVEALASGNGSNRPVQEILQEEERKRLALEEEELRLTPSPATLAKRSRMGGSNDGVRRRPDMMSRVSEEQEQPQQASTLQRPSPQSPW